MNVIVIASNRNVDLLPKFAEQFNRHWKRDQDVIAIHSEVPPQKLPENFLTIRAKGEEKNYGRAWGPSFAHIVEKMPDDRFLLLLEDHFLVEDVNHDRMKWADSYFEKKARPVKVDVSGAHTINKHIPFDGDMIRVHPDARHRYALQPAIWDRDYFVQCIARSGYSIWQIEDRLSIENADDGAIILGVKTPIIKFMNMRNNGVPKPIRPIWNR